MKIFQTLPWKHSRLDTPPWRAVTTKRFFNGRFLRNGLKWHARSSRCQNPTQESEEIPKMSTRASRSPKIELKNDFSIFARQQISQKRQETGSQGTPEALETTTGSTEDRRSQKWPPEAPEIEKSSSKIERPYLKIADETLNRAQNHQDC